MKKLVRLGCSFLMGASFFFLVACGDDDDKGGNGNGDEPETEVTGTVLYKFSSDGSDLLKLVDARITYATASDKDTTVSVTSVPWTKTINIKVPFVAKMEVSFSKKENLELTQETYSINTDAGIAYQLSNNSGKSYNVSGTATLKKERAEDYIDRLVQKSIVRTDTIR